MTRRTRTAALLSTATLLAGAAFSLVVAAPATAAPGDPVLGQLTIDPAQPKIGDSVIVSGTGCLGVPLPPSPTVDPSAAAGAASDAAAAPAAAAAAADDTTSSVAITVSRNGTFYGGDTAQPSVDGSWSGGDGVTINDPGDYTVTASCTLLPDTPGFPYQSIDFTVANPTPPADPSVSCSGCDQANPGDTVTVGGTDFPKGALATITLDGYGNKTARVDDSGGFDPVSFVIGAKQAAGTLDGAVSAGGVSVDYSVSVVLPDDGGGNVDGTVPGSGPGGSGGSGGTDNNGSGDVPVVTSSPNGVDVSSAAPQLPNTGADSLWPGVIGGLLVLSGTGLLWISRHRDDVDVTA